ncbi:hypothetical protein C8R44DRAFT_929238, partial [Mycena epipterygia]
EKPLDIARILDVAQDLKILESLLEVRPFVFALDVAVLTSRREYLNLNQWLAEIRPTIPLSSSSTKKWIARRSHVYPIPQSRTAPCLSTLSPSPLSSV